MENESLTPSQTITYRIYREGDEHGIIRLRKEVTGKDMSLKEWHWKYRGQGNRKVYSVVMEDRNQGIIGHCGGIPLRMIHSGREIYGVVGCNAMIHPKFRGFVRFKKLHKSFVQESLKDSVTFIFGLPTEKTFMLPAEKLGMWDRIETINEFFKDTTFQNNAVRLFYKLFPLDFRDDRINRLWQKAGDQFRLSVIRDASYLRWRYGENPIFHYEIWGLRKRYSRSISALAVFKREQSENLVVMDMVFIKATLPALLTKIENYANSAGKKRLSFFLPNKFNNLLAKMNFSSQSTGATIAVVHHPRILAVTEAREKFFYTMGDTDYL